MEILVLLLSVALSAIAALSDNHMNLTVSNTTDLGKDMYVIHAMVYQIGIVTNITDDKASDNMTGTQEALTFYHTNGSNIDLSALPTPLLTNVTAERMLGVAPAPATALPANSTSGSASLPWADLQHLASLQSATNTGPDKQIALSRAIRASEIKSAKDFYIPYAKALFKRSTTPSNQNETTPVKIIKGAAVLPQEVGVRSLAIPALLSLNNNFSEIPVPIPNTSLVQYAKCTHARKERNGARLIQYEFAETERAVHEQFEQQQKASKQRRQRRLLGQFGMFLAPYMRQPYRITTMRESELELTLASPLLGISRQLIRKEIRESIKSERANSKSEEDWRRRTIIVEKKNGSYGFTLQSYGIHYKKEQEIEVITYVDHVEGEGPAAAAGMREGDVILSINGADVERADHAAIVAAINSCDTRMRMVVIFEDCVRKVELHLKYINLQRALHTKMRELEQLTVLERQLFDSNWKTHSLPSQKKKTSPTDVISDTEDTNIANNMSSSYCRPTLSSENVTAAKPPQANVFMYQYLDPRYGACVIQPNMRTGSFVITVGSPRNRRECHHYVVKNSNECHRASETYVTKNGKHTKVQRNSHSHDCSACMPTYNNQDANSLEAYDLASPCCDPQCVPNSRKKVRRKKECSKEHKRKEKCQQVDKSTQKTDNCSHSRSKKSCSTAHCSGRYRYLTTESTQTSQCSLQSYITSNATAVQCDNSASSYSTSLSSDTLFWDNERPDAKSSPRIQYQSAHQHIKPKSWDNLTTKAFGGYGFGYGYLDTGTKQSNRSKSHGRNNSGRSTQSHHEYHHIQEKNSHRQSATPHHHTVYTRSQSHCAPTKSTESLIVVPKYHLESSSSESRLACDCADTVEYYRRISTAKSPAETHSSYYTQHFIYPSNSSSCKKKDSNVSSEITRL